MEENNTDQAVKANETQAVVSNPVRPSDWRVILLGIYLAVLLLAALYFLGVLMLAKPDLTTSADSSNSNKASNSATQNTAETNLNGSASSNENVPANAGSPANSKTGANANGSSSGNTNNSANRPSNSGTNRSANGPLAGNTNKPANGGDNSNTGQDKGSSPASSIPKDVSVSFFFDRKLELTADGYLFFTVLFAGLLGAVIRCVFSFFRHLGAGDFTFGWIWYYLLLPFGGATLSLVLYFVIRGGFYSSTIGKDLALNLFSFAALGALTGLFSENAMVKLKQVAESLLAPVTPKSDATHVDGDR